MAAPDRERNAVLDRLAALISAVRRPHVVRAAIDGGDAAGKTTLADELRPLLEARGRPVLRTTIDSFHRPRAERHQLARPLPRATTPTPSTTKRSSESCSFVEVDGEEALHRAVVRDEELFGSPDEALRRYRNCYVPGQRVYLDEVDPAAVADLVFDNTDVLAPGLRARSPL